MPSRSRPSSATRRSPAASATRDGSRRSMRAPLRVSSWSRARRR